MIVAGKDQGEVDNDYFLVGLKARRLLSTSASRRCMQHSCLQCRHAAAQTPPHQRLAGQDHEGPCNRPCSINNSLALKAAASPSMPQVPVAVKDHEGPLENKFPVENRLLPQGGWLFAMKG